MLSVDFDPDAEMVSIAGDASSLRDFAERLIRLADAADLGILEHEHLKSAAWAGAELTGNAVGDARNSARPIQHVKIYGLPT